jgi:hypothetical protein
MLSVPVHIRSVVDHDGAVILDIKQDAMITLNATGGYIWDRLQAGKTPDEIVTALSQETGEDPNIVERDFHEFLEQLKAKQLLIR